MQNWIVEIELFICIKMDFALNNLQRLICHKTQTNSQYYDIYFKKMSYPVSWGFRIHRLLRPPHQ